MVNRRNIMLYLLGGIILVLLIAGLMPLNDPLEVKVSSSLQGPSMLNPGGTDRLGRCLFSQASQGLLWSFSLALVAEIISMIAGLLWVGIIRLPKRRFFYTVGRIPIMAFKALPPFLVALSLASLAQGKDWATILALSLFSWPFLSQVLNDEFAWVMHQPHLFGAKTLGVSKLYILRFHIVPIAWPRIVRYALLDMVGLIALEAVFGFVGLSNPERPSLGYMLFLAKDYLGQYPWLFITPLSFFLAGVLTISFAAVILTKSVAHRGIIGETIT
jgi:peptide/nickel transport system permease protein